MSFRVCFEILFCFFPVCQGVRCLSCPSPTDYYNIGSSLLGYYPFNQGSILLDLTGNLGNLIPSTYPPAAVDRGPWAGISAAILSQNMTAQSNPSTDPNGQYFSLPSILFNSSGLSTCLWYMPTSAGSKGISSQHLFHFGNTVGSNTDSILVSRDGTSDRLALQIFVASSVVLSQPISAAGMIQDVWSHLCLVLSDVAAMLYADGSLAATYAVHKPTTFLTRNFIGRSLIATDSLFIGQLADFRVFRRALTPIEVQAVFQYRGDGLSPDLFVQCTGSCPTGTSSQCLSNGTRLCCTSGQYYDSTSSTCARCAAGTYSPDGACRNCSAGSYSAFGVAWCVNCTAGRFSAVSGASACGNCTPGTYSPGFAEIVCLICPPGTESGGGASACAVCTAGTRSSASASVCSACAAHSTSLHRASLCLADAGYYDLGQELAGYYPFASMPNLLSDLSGNAADLVSSDPPPTIGACGPWIGAACVDFGSSQVGGRASSWLAVPELAVAGPQLTICLWVFATLPSPGAAGGGYVAPLFDLGGPAPNPRVVAWVTGGGDLFVQVWSRGGNGSVQLAGAAPPGAWAQACFVADGSVLAIYSGILANLTRLSFSPAFGPPGLGPGFLGRWTDLAPSGGPNFRGKLAEFRLYSAALSAWELGAVANYRGFQPDPSLFVACPAGTYRTGSGGVLAVDCAPCAPGRFSSATGANSSATCAACYVGAAAAGWGFSTCVLCVPGTYQTGVEESNCTECAPGKYSTAYGAVMPRTCLLCTGGTYQTGSGMWYCDMCLPGKYDTGTGAEKAEGCLLCPAGTYQSGQGMVSQSNCTLCAAGGFGPLPGAVSCLLCNAGKYGTGTGLINSSCYPCSTGKYLSNSGASFSAECQSCAVGTFQTGVGMAALVDCILCGAGTYQTGDGMIAANAYGYLPNPNKHI